MSVRPFLPGRRLSDGRRSLSRRSFRRRSCRGFLHTRPLDGAAPVSCARPAFGTRPLGAGPAEPDQTGAPSCPAWDANCCVWT